MINRIDKHLVMLTKKEKRKRGKKEIDKISNEIKNITQIIQERIIRKCYEQL